MKWRTDLVLHVRHGAEIERLISKLTESLTQIGFFVAEFKNDSKDSFVLIRGNEKIMLDFAEQRKRRVLLVGKKRRKNFSQVTPDSFMPFYHSEISSLVRNRINASHDLNFFKKHGFVKSIYRCHDKRVRDIIAANFGKGLMRLLCRHMCALYQEGKHLTYPELDLIQSYFGVNTALYFGFVSFYTANLSIVMSICALSLAGTVAAFFVYWPSYQAYKNITQFLNNSKDPRQAEIIANASANCESFFEDCNSLSFDEYLHYSLTSFIVPITTIVLCLWGSFFMEHWKRKQSELVANWDAHDCKDNEDLRSDFTGDERKSFVTGAMERTYFKKKGYCHRCIPVFLISSVLIIIATAVHVAFGILVVDCDETFGLVKADYCTAIDKGEEWNSLLEQYSFLAMTSLVQGCMVYLFNWIFVKIAKRLARRENHRTDRGFEKSFVTKAFWFQLVNSFLPPFGSLIFKRDLVAVNMSVAAIMLVKLFGDLIFETWVPGLIAKYKKRFMKLLQPREAKKIKTKLRTLKPQPEGKFLEYVHQDKLVEKPTQTQLQSVLKNSVLDPASDPMSEYLELMIQLAFVLFWTGFCPVVPFLAWLNNLFEIHFDAKKFLKQNKPVNPMTVNSIGQFQTVMQMLSYTGVAFGIFSLLMTWRSLDSYAEIMSDYWNGNASPRKDFRALPYTKETAPNARVFKVMIVLVIEHVFILLKIVIDKFVPDEPYWVTQKQERYAYLRGPEENILRGPHHIILDALKETNMLPGDKVKGAIHEAIRKSRTWVDGKKDAIRRTEKIPPLPLSPIELPDELAQSCDSELSIHWMPETS